MVEVPAVPPNVALSIQEGYCNLGCPKCPVHGETRERSNVHRGKMSIDEARQILDELRGSGAVVSPYGYYEPFLQKDLFDYVREIKARGLRVNFNTNGLLLTDDVARMLVEHEVDFVYVSIDAVTEETLDRVRGTQELSKITDAVLRLLAARGGRSRPRVGVTFTTQASNAHESEAFLRQWIEHVDLVRISQLYARGVGLVRKGRAPCTQLYDTMFIHHNGDVPLCPLDGGAETFAGNVLTHGLRAVWRSEAFERARALHEQGRAHEVHFCAGCDDWKRYHFEPVQDTGAVLVRRSPLVAYYDRKDRLHTWNRG